MDTPAKTPNDEAEIEADAIVDHVRRCESRPITGMAQYMSCPFRAQHLERAKAGRVDAA